MIPSPRFKLILVGCASVLVVVLVAALVARSRHRAGAGMASMGSAPGAMVGGSDDGLGPTQLYAHNLRLSQGPAFRVSIRWIRGEMLRTQPNVTPSFDDPETFVLQIDKGVARVSIADVANFLNAGLPANAPLKKVSLEGDAGQLKLHGTVHKVFPLPVELVGGLSLTSDGRVDFHVTKLSVLKIPIKGLLADLHVGLSDLVHSVNIPGVQMTKSDVLFDTRRLLPPPHIQGKMTAITIKGPEIEVIYGNTGNDDAELAQWHNFLRLRGGTLDFGKLTMHDVDLTMIDASQDPWFDLDLVNYQNQLVKGTTRMTAAQGLEIYMPDSKVQAAGDPADPVSLEWLKNKRAAVPPGVVVK